MLRPFPRTITAIVVAAFLLFGAGCAQQTTAGAPPQAESADDLGPSRTASPGSTEATGGSPGTTEIDADADATVAPIAWSACGARRECATYEVPADHADPDGPTVSLALIRRPATGSDRIGSLFMNPGGPGGSGVDYVTASSLDPTLNEYFDIVSWDPRGVGESDPIACDDAVPAMQRIDWEPDDEAEQTELDDAAEAIADDCAERFGERLGQVATDATARDLDVLRRAVGDDALNYIGFSYGTILGLRYAELFPERIRAMVLDGVVDPTQDLEELLTDQAVAFERSVSSAFDTCVSSGSSALSDPLATYDRVAAAVESTPLQVPGHDPVGPAALAYAALSSAYDPSRAATFVKALAAADQGDGTQVRQLADLYWGSTNYTEYTAVVCTDNPHPVGASEFRAMTERMTLAAPRFGAAVASEMLPSAFWNAPVTGVPAPVIASGAPPILVVGNTGDAATPYAAAERVADRLESGVLLTYNGTGHTSFNSDACVKDVVRVYLVDLVVPEPGTECPRVAG